jgi:hypothetical protein
VGRKAFCASFFPVHFPLFFRPFGSLK